MIKSNVKKYFVWRIITDDGLVKNPDSFGPYYDKEYINGYYDDGFGTEQEAMDKLGEFDQRFPWSIQGDWTLITLYTVTGE
jgi:hypothetical protein